MHSVTYGNIRYPKEIFTKIKKTIQKKVSFLNLKKIKEIFMMKIMENLLITFVINTYSIL